MVQVKLIETPDEILGILNLQKENLKESVSKDERQTEGFVTVEHSLETLMKMNIVESQVIAVENERIIGYALVLSNSLRNEIEILKPLFNTIDSLTYKSKTISDYSYYVMGQICIAKEFRGKGIFKQLYNKHLDMFSSKYDLCITEVSSSNTRSLNAHLNYGFDIIKTYADKTDTWCILVKNI